MQIQWSCLKLSEMSPETLYKVIQLRELVFVVGQECIYLDCDGKDIDCLHVIGTDTQKNQVVATARLYTKTSDLASFGRVATHPDVRGKGIGKELVLQSIQAIKKDFSLNKIEISAQSYLEKFYSDFGFQKEGEEYLDTGIPHIKMTGTF